jgi:hypothetical protein
MDKKLICFIVLNLFIFILWIFRKQHLDSHKPKSKKKKKKKHIKDLDDKNKSKTPRVRVLNKLVIEIWYLTLLLQHLTFVKRPYFTVYDPWPYTVKFNFGPHQRIISTRCDIWLYSLSYKNKFLLVCIVLPFNLKNLKLYVNVRWLPCCWKLCVLSVILALVMTLLNFKQLCSQLSNTGREASGQISQLTYWGQKYLTVKICVWWI